MPRTAQPHSDGERSARQIRVELQQLGDALRARYRVLAHQDALGFAIFLVSCGAIIANATLYYQGRVPVLWVVLSSAFFMSLLHELEHDLIHYLYFRQRPALYNAVLASVWLLRPSTISPWIRRGLHLHHHKLSGTESDMEERAITLGEPTGVRRTLMMADGLLAVFLRFPVFVAATKAYAASQSDQADERMRIRWRLRLGYVPIGHLHFALWHGYLLLLLWWLSHALFGLVSPANVLPEPLLTTLEYLVVVWLLPNVVRSFCLNFVSSNMHYYGDIEPKNVMQQTQVWTAAWTWPFQLFCFNFGGTHAIHHFVVRDPFYIRQWMAKDAQAVLRKYGVRFDDFGTFRRNNRWSSAPVVPATDLRG